MEVPAQEPQQRTGEDEAEHRDDRLIDRRRQVDQPQRHRRDERDPRGQAVEAVDEVDAVDHPHDPEDREARREGAAERDDVAAERIGDERDVDPEGDGEDAEAHLSGELPAGAKVEEVVDRAKRGRRGPTHQQRGQLAGQGRTQRLFEPERQEPAEVVGRDETQGHGDECRCHRDPAAAGDRDDIDPAGLGSVDHPVADDQPPDERGQDQGEQRRGDERHDDRDEGVAERRDEVHRTNGPWGARLARTDLTRPSGRERGSGRRSRGPRRRAATAPPHRRDRGSRR